MTLLCPSRLSALILYLKDQENLYRDYMKGLEELAAGLDILSPMDKSPIEILLPNICTSCGSDLGECIGGALKHVCSLCHSSKPWTDRILRFYWEVQMAQILQCTTQQLESHMALAISYVARPTETRERYGNHSNSAIQ